LIHSSNPSSQIASSKSSLIIAIAVTIAMLYFGRRIFIPLALALVLSFLLTPLVGWLQRIRVGRIPAVLVVLVFCFAVTAGVGWGVAGQLLEITTHIRDYKTNLEEKVHALHTRKSAPLKQASATVQQLNKELASPSPGNNPKNNHSPQPVPVQVAAPPTNFIQELRNMLGPLTGPMENALLTIVFVGFMLVNREDLRNRLIRLGGQGQINVMTQALEDASDGLSRYLLMQLLVNASYGALFGLAIYFIGVPHALLWGAIAAVLRFVPYVGVWIAVAFPMAMALAVFPGWQQAILTFAVFAVLELMVANIIEPWIYGSHTGISSLAILVAAVFWASLWGPVGLILSTPLTLCIILVGRYVPRMNFLEILLGDAPVLRCEEVFYQRLLAMDEDEARNIAEDYLRNNSLANLYESVLIPALRLAEEDRHSDVLGDRSADFISQTTRELIDELGDRITQDKAKAEAPANGPTSADSQVSSIQIGCIPARDPADELVGMMLAQMLQQAGYTSVRYLAIGTVEDMLKQVGEGGFRIVCISALPPFAVGQARSLCKRLHARFPDVAIVVGLWGFTGGVIKAQERVGPACTDAVSTTLSEALLQVRRLAHMDETKLQADDRGLNAGKTRSQTAAD
jgi:predicted PurR-regulated permease PerM